MGPTYVSLGPVYGTESKEVAFRPRGLGQVERWRELVEEGTPLVAIGGINSIERGKEVRGRGAETVAVLGLVMGKGEEEVKRIIEEWREEL
jgi:thiamine monophosphate synthase